MLERLPWFVGSALTRIRAGMQELAIQDPELEAPRISELELRSPTFCDHGLLPARYTADGSGLSPPLAWSKMPTGTRSVLLVVEDADSPTPKPLVHAIVAIDPHGANSVKAPFHHRARRNFTLGVTPSSAQDMCPPTHRRDTVRTATYLSCSLLTGFRTLGDTPDDAK